MSTRLRGIEITALFTVDDVPQTGSFMKIEDLEATPEDEITKHDFIGERTTDGDYRHDNFGLSWTIHITDVSALAYLDLIVSNEENHLRHPDLSMQITYNFRDGVTPPQMVIYHGDMIVKQDAESVRGRKEFVTVKYTAFAKYRERMPAPF